MILSLSGKANSGKDLVARIIQGLTVNEDADLGYIEKFHTNSNFINKKWADKLKDIVCLLTGATREQLENRDFKESELGEEWKVWNAVRIHDGQILSKPFSTYSEALISSNLYSYKVHCESRILTPRLLLQLLGTECGRNVIHPQIWVNALMSEYKSKEKILSYATEYIGSGEYVITSPQHMQGMIINSESFEYYPIKPIYPNWIISDTRFPNELQAVKDVDGLTINIIRHNHPNDVNLETEHISETALDNASFDEVIINDGSIYELIGKVKEILIKHKII